MKVSEVLTSGVPVLIELLYEFPLDSNPDTWKRIPQAKSYCFPSPTFKTDNAVGGQFECTIPILPKDVDLVQAFSVTHQGQTLLTAHADKPPSLKVAGLYDFLANWLCQPWEQE